MLHYTKSYINKYYIFINYFRIVVACVTPTSKFRAYGIIIVGLLGCEETLASYDKDFVLYFMKIGKVTQNMEGGHTCRHIAT
jgi:hypothetical protein